MGSRVAAVVCRAADKVSSVAASVTFAAHSVSSAAGNVAIAAEAVGSAANATDHMLRAIVEVLGTIGLVAGNFYPYLAVLLRDFFDYLATPASPTAPRHDALRAAAARSDHRGERVRFAAAIRRMPRARFGAR